MVATVHMDREGSDLPTLRFVTVMLILVTVAGCAHWDRREPHRLDTWIGSIERKLVLAAGAPDSVHVLKDGGRILTWRRSYSERRGGETTTVTETRIVDGQTVIVPITRQEAGVEYRYECTASFEVDDDRVVRAHEMHGNDCDNFLK